MKTNVETELVLMVKSWQKQLKKLKKKMSKDDHYEAELEKMDIINNKLMAFCTINKKTLLENNPKNNQKTYDKMLAEYKKIEEFVRFHRKNVFKK